MVSQKPHRKKDQGASTESARLSESGEHRLRDIGREVAEQARAKAHEASERARQSGRSVLHSQKERAIAEIGVISDAVWQAADKIREEDDHNVADVVEGIAARLDNVSDYLKQHHLEDVLEDVSAFGRRRPEILLGGMFCIGLAIGRLLKASGSPRPYSEEAFGDEFGDRGGSPFFGDVSASVATPAPRAASASASPDQSIEHAEHIRSSPAFPGGARVEPEGASLPSDAAEFGSSKPGDIGEDRKVGE